MNEGSIHPLLGTFVMGAPPMGVGLPMKTTYRFAQNGGGVNMVVNATRLVDGTTMSRTCLLFSCIGVFIGIVTGDDAAREVAIYPPR